MPEIEMLDGVRSVDAAQWDRLVGDASPFLEWSWLASLEESGCLGAEHGWLPKPLVAREGDAILAACPVYVKGHSEGEFVFDWSWADAAERAGMRYYPKLLVGVPFTPVTGTRFLVAPGEDRARWVGALADALRQLCDDHELSGAHVNFCEADEQDALAKAGFLPRLGFQYHWNNAHYADFDAYLARFRSKRRNQIRRERRELAAQGVTIERRVGAAIPEAWFEPMFRFYRATVDHNPWGRRYLNAGFFEQMATRFRERLCFVVALRDGEPIAGTFNVQKGEVLYGRYWGATVPLRHLHFNVCYYAAIEHCIEHGLRRFEPGAGGQYKQVRGFDAQPTYSAHYLRDRRLSDAVAHFLERERADAQYTLDWYRENGSLKPL